MLDSTDSFIDINKKLYMVDYDKFKQNLIKPETNKSESDSDIEDYEQNVKLANIDEDKEFDLENYIKNDFI